MKINITKKEYRLLIDLLYLGHWIMDSHLLPAEAAGKPHNQFLQKMYSFAKVMGCEELIRKYPGRDTFYETAEFEESLNDTIRAYDEQNFWEDLISYLADRDFWREWGDSNKDEPDLETRIRGLTHWEGVWAEEFEKHGLDNLEVAGQPS